MQVDLEFNVGDVLSPFVVNQAIIALDGSYDTQWPIDMINGALAFFYSEIFDNDLLDRPWIYHVYDVEGRVKGYVIYPRDDHVDVGPAFDALVDLMSDEDEWYCDTWNNKTACAVRYAVPYGPEMPLQPINEAIHLMMGQLNWPRESAVFIYPVRKDGNPNMDGLILAEKMDDVADVANLDDAIFNRVHAMNDDKTVCNHPVFGRKRFTIE